MEITLVKVEEINKLHQEIIGLVRTGLVKAIRIGELLAEVKTGLPHGDFLPWIKKNCAFSDRTARNYIKVYENQDKLETVSDLTTAYRLLEEPREEPREEDKTARVADLQEAYKPEEPKIDEIQRMFSYQPKVEILPGGMGLKVLEPLLQCEWVQLVRTATCLKEDAAAWIIGDLLVYGEKKQEGAQEVEALFIKVGLLKDSGEELTRKKVNAWIRDGIAKARKRGEAWTDKYENFANGLMPDGLEPEYIPFFNRLLADAIGATNDDFIRAPRVK